MSSTTWSFCKKCEKYHVNWDKDGFDKYFETHLDPQELEDARSFPIYRKEVHPPSGVFMILPEPNTVKEAMKLYPSGFFEVC